MKSATTFNKAVSLLNFLIPAFLLGFLTIIALINYPIIFDKAKTTVYTVLIAIVIYFILWLLMRPDIFSRNGGFLIGFLFIVNISVEDFINWRTKTSTLISTLAMMFLIFISFSIISAIKMLQTKSFSQGIKSSFISALLGTLVALCFGFLINYLFEQTMISILRNDPGHEYFADPKAFIFFNAFDNASNHVIIAPVVSIIMGSLGCVIALVVLQRKNRKQVNA